MNSNNKTVFNYLDGASTVAQVIKDNQLVSTELKAEITTTFKSLFKSGKVKEINKIGVEDKACYIIRFDETNNLAYVNIPKNNTRYYNEFDSMYIQKNRLNNQRIKNLRIFGKTVTGVLVATSIAAAIGGYAHWLSKNDKEIFETMEKTNEIIDESAGFNPQAAYEQALDELGIISEETPMHKK